MVPVPKELKKFKIKEVYCEPDGRPQFLTEKICNEVKQNLIKKLGGSIYD